MRVGDGLRIGSERHVAGEGDGPEAAALLALMSAGHQLVAVAEGGQGCGCRRTR